MNNDFNLNQHKKSDFIKWIITFTALILLSISVIALAANAFGVNFNNDTTPETEQTTEDTTINPVVPTNPDEAPQAMSTMKIVNSDMMKLAAKAPAMYANSNTNTVELNATAYPIGSENGGFVWSAAWVNPNSAFATGKDVYNYIELEGDEGGSTCYVSALAPFGEQIVITVSTVFNPNAKATCTVDYSEKFLDTQYLEVYTDNFFQNQEVYNGGTDWLVNPIIVGTKQELINAYQNSDNIDFSYLKSDTYTMDMLYDDYEYHVTVSEEFYDVLASVGIELEEWQTYSFGPSGELTPAQVLNSLCCGEIIPLSSGSEVDYELINKFNEAITLWDDIAFYIEVDAYSEYGSTTYSYNFVFDASAIASITTNVELNETGIIF